jgi:hypothetical protein
LTPRRFATTRSSAAVTEQPAAPWWNGVVLCRAMPPGENRKDETERRIWQVNPRITWSFYTCSQLKRISLFGVMCYRPNCIFAMCHRLNQHSQCIFAMCQRLNQHSQCHAQISLFLLLTRWSCLASCCCS